MRTQWGATFFLCTRRQPSSDTKSASTLILAASASRTVRNKFLLFLSRSIYGTMLQQSERTRAVVIATKLISPGDALSSKNKTMRRNKNTKTSKEQWRSGRRWWLWLEMASASLRNKYPGHTANREGEGEGRERMRGRDFYSPDRTAVTVRRRVE